jgi:hypothetical protein
MLAMIFSLPIISLTIAVGVFLPWLGLRLELTHRAERRAAAMLEAQAQLIEEHEATINAYRELVSTDASFSLTAQ